MAVTMFPTDVDCCVPQERIADGSLTCYYHAPIHRDVSFRGMKQRVDVCLPGSTHPLLHAFGVVVWTGSRHLGAARRQLG